MNASTQFAQSPVWQGGELRCIERIDETHDSATFVLAADTPARFDYLPGQFLTIGIEIAGAMQYRAYSISSSPSSADRLSITVKRVTGGKVSNHLIDHCRADSVFATLGVAGEFRLDTGEVPEDVVLLSAGSGITPVMSMARWLHAHRPDVRIRFIHSARSARDIIFREELLTLAKQHPNFDLQLFLSQPDDSLPCHAGRLTPERLDALLPDAARHSYYLCGHQGYMDMVNDWYASRQLPAERLHQESFTPAALAPVATGGASFEVSVPAFGKLGTIAEGQALLDVLEAEGLPIIAACRSGVCGSCKCKVTQGEIERLSSETLTAEELDAGYVLACSTRVRSAVTVEI